MVFCTDCGQQQDDAQKFCRFCGERLPGPMVMRQMREEQQLIAARRNGGATNQAAQANQATLQQLQANQAANGQLANGSIDPAMAQRMRSTTNTLRGLMDQ